MINLATILDETAAAHPDETAVVFQSFRLNYATVNAMANQVAQGLVKAGIKPGDHVALSCPNLPYFPIVYYGILKAGAAFVPLNVLLREREIEYHLSDSESVAYIAFEGTPELPLAQLAHSAFNKVDSCQHFWIIPTMPGGESPIEGVPTLGALMADHPPMFDTVQCDANDTCLIIYTSGTTGRPKGAELSHSNMMMNLLVNERMLSCGPGDVNSGILPLFHSFGISGLNMCMKTGATVVLLPRFDAEATLQMMQDEGVTMFAGVPTMYWDLLNCKNLDNFDLDKIKSTLRIGISGGAAMPVEVMKAFEEKFGCKILEGYGLSETSPTASFNREDRPRKVGSIGLPVWGVDMKIVDDDMNEQPVGEKGEIVIRGHNIMKGYYNKPEANEEAFRGGWFHSGDVGYMDEDGYFFIVDRTKDMVIRGGFNVYPRELEEVLITHPAISLAAVIGVPHEEYGEEVKAYVILKEGTTATEDEIKAWGKEQFAAYKYPRIVEIVDQVPMGPTGKILKTELRKMATETAAK
jgi:long-chain acyl-CoA synthetase